MITYERLNEIFATQPPQPPRESLTDEEYEAVVDNIQKAIIEADANIILWSNLEKLED